MAAFGNFCPVQKLFEYEIRKVKVLLLCQFWKLTNLGIFFQKSYSLAPKIEVCLKYFLHKNSQKQPLWIWKDFVQYDSNKRTFWVHIFIWYWSEKSRLSLIWFNKIFLTTILKLIHNWAKVLLRRIAIFI